MPMWEFEISKSEVAMVTIAGDTYDEAAEEARRVAPSLTYVDPHYEIEGYEEIK